MNVEIIAALLHDIGKVGQRAGCSGRHEEIGSALLRAVLPENLAEAVGLVSMHHEISSLSSPGFEPLKRVIISDWISAGERAADESAKDVHSPLIALFSHVDIGKGDPQRHQFYYIPGQLQIDDTIFPKERVPSTEEAYNSLWKGLSREFSTIKMIKDPDAYLVTALYLMKKYTWSVPSAAYRSIPDVSLYDHSRTTSAIAACLRPEEVGDLLKEIDSRESAKERFLLVKGDISGIQSFIYTITSKGALKGLRGRSFYLQLLSEATAKFILRELGYPQTNLIYSGGGHFYLLLRSSDEEKLPTMQKRIEKAMLEMHHGDLFLALGWSKLTVNDLLRSTETGSDSIARGSGEQSLSLKWKEAGESANAAKLRKFSEIASEEYDEIFGPFRRERGGSASVCDVCKRELALPISQQVEGGAPDNPVLCELCKTFEKIGERLPRAEYLVEAGVKSEQNDALLCSFDPLHIHYYACRRAELPQLLSSLAGSSAVIYSLSPEGFIDEQLVLLASESSAALGFRLVARAAPMRDGRILDNTDLARLSEGVHRLGILRMDVDDLGLIFSKGLENATFSRISTLSTMLSVFFDGWVDEICRNAGRLYLIYSGGDDLFIIGSWDAVPEIALKIREYFRKYTCYNPNLTLSAGISIVDDMFPIYKAADLAKDGLESAKGIERYGKMKDAVFFLGETLDWTEFRISQNISSSLKSWIKEGRDGEYLPRSLLNILYKSHELYRKNREMLRKSIIPEKDLDRLALYDRWRWRMVYYLDRLAERSKAFKDDLTDLRQSILESRWRDIKSQREIIEYLAIPVRWAELLTREVKE